MKREIPYHLAPLKPLKHRSLEPPVGFERMNLPLGKNPGGFKMPRLPKHWGEHGDHPLHMAARRRRQEKQQKQEAPRRFTRYDRFRGGGY